MKAKTNRPTPGAVIQGLISDGPDPKLREKLSLFGQFIGDWEIEAQWFQPRGTTRKGKGELHFGWILNGQAVQDVWISHKQGRKVAAGTTIRFYDPKLDAWHCTWISPSQGIVRTFLTRKVADEIVLEGTTKEGYPERWIFSEIRPNSFRWRAV